MSRRPYPSHHRRRHGPPRQRVPETLLQSTVRTVVQCSRSGDNFSAAQVPERVKSLVESTLIAMRDPPDGGSRWAVVDRVRKIWHWLRPRGR